MNTIFLTLLWLWTQGPPATPPQNPAEQPASSSEQYVIGPRDVLKVTIFNEEQLSREMVPVEGDGTIEYPLIGRVKVGGLTTRQVAQELEKLLGTRKGPDGRLVGFLVSPQITVGVRDYRSVRVWVMGEVVRPGAIDLQGGRATLLDAIAEAGSFAASAGSTLTVVHASGGDASGPTLPDRASSQDQQQYSREDVFSGAAARVRLRDGDTVVVSRAAEVYVTGQVRSPAKYVITPKTTVLQAITLAGGYTERAAKNRIEIEREIKGKKQKIRVKESDLVRADDVIIVPAKRI
jgi:polysaccharide export outer membrane protein